MDPFALQQAARTRTFRLVPLAAVAIIATAMATGLVFLLACWGVWLYFGDADLACDATEAGIAAFCRAYPQVGAACFVFSFLLIAIATLSKFFGLSSGDMLMKSIGATRLRRGKVSSDAEADLARDRFLNVCEEMSIASGLDMPTVWVLEGEGGVNALAAGTDPSSAAVCVTRGALEWLTRDELQGVVAHEFSHILNGDMRLNFRLTALVAGISSVSRFGKGMLSLLGGDGEDGSCVIVVPRGKSKGKGGGPLPLLVIYVLTGIALWLVGSIGTFFARLVQCAVSREREFLADAASAQFTRNPEGLANALRFTYLADVVGGGRAFGAWKGDVSHMLFASTGDSLFETHPPVKERIRRLSPRGETAADESVKSRINAVKERRRAMAKAANENFAKSVSRARGLKAADVSLADAKVQPAVLASARSPAKAGGMLIALLRGQVPEGWAGGMGRGDFCGRAAYARAQVRQHASGRCVDISASPLGGGDGARRPGGRNVRFLRDDGHGVRQASASLGRTHPEDGAGEDSSSRRRARDSNGSVVWWRPRGWLCGGRAETFALWPSFAADARALRRCD